MGLMARAAHPLRDQLRATAAEAMLRAAERAMIERGYEKATMQEIAAEAGCATGTFYLYFKNKVELFEAIVARHAEAMFGAARAGMDRADDPLDKIRLATEAFLHYVMDHRPFFRLFYSAMPARQRALHQKVGNVARREHDAYNRLELEVLKKAQKLGRVRRDLPAEMLQEFMTAVCLSLSEQFVFDPEKQDVDEQVRMLWGLITGGLGAGRKA